MAVKTKSVVVRGRLTVPIKHWSSVTVDNTVARWHSKSTNEPMDFGNDMKAAASDALKKCASRSDYSMISIAIMSW